MIQSVIGLSLCHLIAFALLILLYLASLILSRSGGCVGDWPGGLVDQPKVKLKLILAKTTKQGRFRYFHNFKSKA